MRKLLFGWSLVLLISLVAAISYFAVIAWTEPLNEAIRLVVVLTARCSFLLFSLYFLSVTLRVSDQSYNKVSYQNWLILNEKYFAISFFISHFFHAVGLLAFYQIDPLAFLARTTVASYIVGIPGYLIILGLTISYLNIILSKEKDSGFAKKVIIPFGYAVWVLFILNYLKRALSVNFIYWLPVLVLFLLMAHRLKINLKRP
ncbi:MAG: hypothetical protein V4654_08275 [Bdellovibrionota bacterium]